MTYIIAELGVNFRDLQDADQLIRECANAGVNACKFQIFKEEHIKGHPRFEELKKIILGPDEIRYLYYRCLNYSVDFIATPFYPEAIDMIAPYVKYIKVRFKDHDNIDILQKINAYSTKVLISTDKVGIRNPNVNYLFCVPEYPPTSIPDLKCFNGFDGYSCHIPVVNHVSFAANFLHLKYVEVHVMLENNPIDQKVSLTIPDLKKLVAAIRIPELYKKGTETLQGGLLDDENYWI